MVKRKRRTRRVSRNVILTDGQGRPFHKPERADFTSDYEFVRAKHEYSQRVTNEANRAFDESLRKSRSKKRVSRKRDAGSRHGYGGVRMCPCPGEHRAPKMITYDPEEAQFGRDQKRRRSRPATPREKRLLAVPRKTKPTRRRSSRRRDRKKPLSHPQWQSRTSRFFIERSPHSTHPESGQWTVWELYRPDTTYSWSQAQRVFHSRHSSKEQAQKSRMRLQNRVRSSS